MSQDLLPPEHLPKARRTLREWFYDLLFPPTPYEAEGRVLRLYVAERVRLRNQVQARRLALMEQRRAERAAQHEEWLGRTIVRATWTVTLKLGTDPLGPTQKWTALLHLEELINQGGLRQITMKSLTASDGGHRMNKPSTERVVAAVRSEYCYGKYALPWKDGLLSEEDLRSSKPDGMLFPAKPEKRQRPKKTPPLKDSDRLELEELRAVMDKLPVTRRKGSLLDSAVALTSKLRAYEHSNTVLEYMAEWERKNGTLAAILPSESYEFVNGLRQAAVRSSLRTTSDQLAACEGSCEDEDDETELEDVFELTRVGSSASEVIRVLRQRSEEREI